MRVLFRSDSSNLIGSGHVMRDIVLAKQMVQAEKIIFAAQNLEGNINSYIKQEGYKVVTIDSNDINEVIAVVKKYNINMIVIDHYKIKYAYEKKLKETTGVKILSFDDTYEKHHCDILLNHNLSASPERYKSLVPKHCELRCGKDFTLIRDEFINERKKQKLHIFLAMGGVDATNINVPILQILEEFEHIKVHVMTLHANRHLEELEDFAHGKKFIKLHIDSDKVAKLMRKCDFAILTPSVIVHEAIYMRLPFVAIKTMDNQTEMYHYLKEKKNYVALDAFDAEELKSLVVQMVDKINFY